MWLRSNWPSYTVQPASRFGGSKTPQARASFGDTVHFGNARDEEEIERKLKQLDTNISNDEKRQVWQAAFQLPATPDLNHKLAACLEDLPVQNRSASMRKLLERLDLTKDDRALESIIRHAFGEKGILKGCSESNQTRVWDALYEKLFTNDEQPVDEHFSTWMARNLVKELPRSATVSQIDRLFTSASSKKTHLPSSFVIKIVEQLTSFEVIPKDLALAYSFTISGLTADTQRQKKDPSLQQALTWLLSYVSQHLGEVADPGSTMRDIMCYGTNEDKLTAARNLEKVAKKQRASTAGTFIHYVYERVLPKDKALFAPSLRDAWLAVLSDYPEEGDRMVSFYRDITAKLLSNNEIRQTLIDALKAQR